MPEGSSESESEVEKLRTQLVELTKKNQELRWKNEQLERLNRSLLESASWRVTAPLRSFGTFVNRAAEKLRSLQSQPLEDDRRMPGDPELLEPPEVLASWPSLTVVSAVYNKARELPFFLEAFARQSYPGELEVIVVDDCSTDSTRGVLEEARKKWRWLRCERLEKNSGQCRARNLGISLAKGSIVFVMDGDCVTSGRFLERHAKKHVLQDELDIVLGPYNLETGDQDPWAVLAQTENEPARVLSELRMDQRRPESFLNCITRNMSIKRRFLERNGLLSAAYDEAFSYSASGEGYGFEDVEAGYRFYELGARISFDPRAFVLHVTHPPLVAEGKRKLGLARNWKKLLEKHPSLPLVAREWTNRTFLDMKSFLEKSGVDGREVLDACIPLASVAVLENVTLAPPKPKKRLRVLTYRWHCGHQYELWKLPHDFTLARGLTAMCDRWDYRSRPFPENARFQNLEELDLSAFDVGILHFDENSLSPENSSGQLQPDWGAIFQHLKRNARIPLVAICHGTPQFFGQYDHALERRSLEIKVDEDERKKLVDFLSDVLVICNSHQAEKEWGFKKSRVIWHGFDPSEYPPARRKKGILTVAERIKTRPHYRGYYLYEDVTRDLECEILSPDMPNGVRVQEPSLYARTLNEYGSQWFRSYVDLIRDYSIFFNPTLRSPMPRARGEAMLAGLATVSAKNHDVERFVENGKNGFFATEARELNEQLKFLLKDERRARAIGEAGREAAMRVFHLDRYLAEWQNVLDSVTS